MIVIVYATESKHLRRIVVDASPPASQYCHPGESFLPLPPDSDHSHATCIRLICEAHGIDEIPSDRCAVVANGTVVSIIKADPSIDNLPGMTLVQSESLQVGDTVP